MMLEQLKALMPPPASPAFTGSPDRWEEVETKLGTRLPADYKQLVHTYGAGEFGAYVSLHNPFWGSEEESGNLLHERHATLAYYNRLRADGHEEMDYPSYPEPGGILPLGRTVDRMRLFWITEGDPDDWPVLLWEPAFDEEIHRTTVATFLTVAFSGKLESRMLPDDLAEEPVEFRQYTESSPA